MSNFSTDGPNTFGSSYREGREQPSYQTSRLKMLCEYALRMAEVHASHLRETQRRAAEVWRGSRWLDEQLAQHKEWNEQLEQGKVWLEQQWQNWMRLAQEREKFLEEQKVWSDQLQAINADLDRKIHECSQTIERQRGELERRNERVRLLESELARLLERGTQA